MRMLGSPVDAQIAWVLAAERTTREHPLHRLFDDAFGEPAFQNEFGGTFLDAARIASEVIVYLMLALAAGEDYFFGVDDDDVIAIVQMRRESRLVLAAQPQGDQRGEPSDDDRLGGISPAEHLGFRYK